MAVGTFDSTILTDAGWHTTFRAGVWTSPDGRAWLRYPDNAAFDGFSLNRVIAMPDGEVIAVGYGTDPDRAVIVRGHDGKFGPVADGSWNDARILDIATTDGGFAAVGGTIAGNSSRAVVWLSSDSWTWDRRNGPSAAAPFTAIAYSQRGLIAAGPLGGPSARSEASTTFWLSRDGRTWSEAGTIPNAGVRAVLDDGAGFLAAGWTRGSGSLQAAAWSSSDGRNWQQMPSPESTGTLTSLTSTADAIVAVGFDLGEPSSALVWISRDGVEWTGSTDPNFGDAALYSITTTVDGVVAVGQVGPIGDARPLVLLGLQE